MVAGAAARSDWLWKFSLSVDVVVCRNTILISPGSLVLDGLLLAKDCESDFPSDVVDYEAVIPFKIRLLETAWTNFKAGERKDLRTAYDEFCS